MSNRIVNFLLLQFKNLLLTLFVGILGSMMIHNATGEVQFFMSAEAAGFSSTVQPTDVHIQLNPSNPSSILSIDFLASSRSIQQGALEIQVNGLDEVHYS